LVEGQLPMGGRSRGIQSAAQIPQRPRPLRIHLQSLDFRAK
jgi:hypothetical protein